LVETNETAKSACDPKSRGTKLTTKEMIGDLN
jgi:hypothetical protein